jgi:hypothetical protein
MTRKLQVLAGGLAASAAVAAVAAAAASPTVTTGGTSSVTQTSAILHGSVNPNGSSTTYYFQWGLTNAYGDSGRPRSAGSGVRSVAVDETAGGLIPGTIYHYRLVATNGSGMTVGADRTFKTGGHPPPGVSTGPATQVNTNGATLTGAVNPAGATTSWWFEWGGTSSYGLQTSPQKLAAGSSPQSVAASLQGLLAAGTIYHFRLDASHSGSATSVGTDGIFMTHPSPRPVPGISARTTPGRARLRPFVFNTSGALTPPSWMPDQFACYGNVTIRFFRGTRQVGFTLAGIQPNCTFVGQTVFNRVPGRPAMHPVRLRVVIRSISNAYLATNRARIQHVKLG